MSLIGVGLKDWKWQAWAVAGGLCLLCIGGFVALLRCGH